MAGSLVRSAMRRTYLGVRYHIVPRIGHALTHRRSPHRLISQWPEGTIPLGPNVCVFVHWDGGGDVRDHVLHQVTQLAESGLSVVFVTNSGRLLPAAMERLKPVCAGIMIRQNVGYDFGAWREGIERLALPRDNTAMVVIANDSVYGPLRSLDGLFAHVDFTQADVWGCTESWQHRYHLQSYLIAFGPAVVRSEAWRLFWAGVRPTWSKNWLIRLYEVGLTQTLLSAGFRCRAIWPYAALCQDIEPDLLRNHKEGGPNLADPVIAVRQDQARRIRAGVVQQIALNPTSDLWRQLLQARYPFMKRELLRSNPTFVPDVAEWREVACTDPAVLLPGAMATIELDLQRTLKNKAP